MESKGVTGATPVPCRHCEDRHPACHDSCERYQEYKRKRNEINDKRQEDHKFMDRLYRIATNKLIRDQKGK